MNLAPGTSVGRYRIVGTLGAGGMGVVYAAEDTRLGRRVALKFLPEQLARDREALDRFQREARAASALNHPHICTIYDIGEAEPVAGSAPSTSSGQAGSPPSASAQGAPFIAMELLEGRTLRERLHAADRDAGRSASAKGGTPLRVSEIVDLGLQLADALEAAHAQGILHRDLKPANIFLTTRGTAKLLDFGVAKLLSEPRLADAEAPTTAGPWVTGAGVTLGTVGYMSPEQVRGEALDARTDLFSLGVVLYEMATGLAPFRGATSGLVLTEILTKAPTAPVRLNPKVPPDLDRIVNTLLEKDRALRCQSATDLRADLDRLRRALGSPAAGRPQQASIVVLPFENLSPDPDNAYFADGLTEEIIADLSKVRALRVISRTSAMKFKGTGKGLPEIARDLNVRHVLEGSVRKAGSNLRITAQLIDAATDAHLWAEKYSGTLDDVFDLQERLSRRIVEALRIALTPDEERRLLGRRAPDARARDTWARARHELLTLTSEGVDRAIQLIEQAMRIVGDDATLHAGLAFTLTLAYDVGVRHNEATLLRAEASAARALELDPDQSQAWLARGYARLKRGDAQAFFRDAKRAVQLESGGEALALYGGMLSEAGKVQEALRHTEEAAMRDPLTFLPFALWGIAEVMSGQTEAGFLRIRDAADRLADSSPFAGWWVAQSAAYAGHDDEARAAFERVAAMEASPFSEWSTLFLRALSGDRGGVVRWFASADDLLEVARTDEYYPCYYASCLAWVGEIDAALQWVDQAISWWFSNHEFLAKHNRFLARLRGDPRFEALVNKAREQERAFEV